LSEALLGFLELRGTLVRSSFIHGPSLGAALYTAVHLYSFYFIGHDRQEHRLSSASLALFLFVSILALRWRATAAGGDGSDMNGTGNGTRRSIVITGASSGIGRATAMRLVRSGWRVFATVRREGDATTIRGETGGAVETVQLDVVDKDSIAAAARDIATRLDGRGLDALFNNAGIGDVFSTEYGSLEALRRIYEVNLFGQIAVIQALLPLVRMAKGRIVNAGSVGDHIAPPFAGALSSSKAAFASMSAALRLELRPQGIYVCIIEPGAINTPAVDKTLGGVEQAIADMPAAGVRLYGEAMRRMARTFSKTERAGSPPEAVAEVVERALTDRHPRPRYSAGKDSAKLALLARFLPENLVDRAILRTFGLPTAFGQPVG
jgi:NAD(P)-dependent dehydrogenase (short-subunit alcohol dehydrogenase family)